jgi:cbb3-type cytochrome oxidase maturation protein
VNVLAITIPVSLLLVVFFVIAFIMAVKRDQFEDLVTPAHRMLLDEDETFQEDDVVKRKDGARGTIDDQ